MKKLFFNLILLLSLVGLTGITSCKKEKVEDKRPPKLTGVTDLNNRTTDLSAVNYGDWIILKGEHLATAYQVDFNSVLASDSLLYADDTSVTVKIPSVLPDPANNPITVTTKYGSATLNFRILQPAPVINSFDPMAGPSGQTITIAGNYFGGVTSVMIGNIEATIISSTKDEIKISVPAGITWGYITVATASGSVVSTMAYGFRYAVYEDALSTGWRNTSYSATASYTNTNPVRRGVNSIKNTCTANWGALRITKSSPFVNLAGYNALKFSIYVPAASVGKKVKVSLNGQSSSGYTIIFAKQGWNDYQIPLINLGRPSTLSSITFQEFSGMRQEFFVDDIGLF
jgi:hypothetical protein